MFPEWTVLVGFYLGATIGSFLNMAIYRLPRKISFVDPAKSMCPSCKHSLGAADLFPIFSWLLLGGKCRYCKAKVSSRYLFVELLCGSLWGAIWWQYFIASAQPATAIAFAAAAALLVLLSFIDWETFEIPDEVNALILVVGLAYHGFTGDFMAGVWGALWGWGILWGITLMGRVMFGKDAMGHGDIKLMRGVGAVVGAKLLVVAIMIAVFLGAVIGGTLAIVAKRQAAEAASDEGEPPPPESFKSLFLLGAVYALGIDIVALFFPGIYRWLEKQLPNDDMEDEDFTPTWTHIPFGPYLALGTIICMIFARPLEHAVNEYLENMGGARVQFQPHNEDGVERLRASAVSALANCNNYGNDQLDRTLGTSRGTPWSNGLRDRGFWYE